MFEKEAEKHADGIYHYKINVSDYGEDGIINYRYSDVKEAYQKGAEFGYNKAKVEIEEGYRESLCNSELNLANVTEQLEELEKANEWHNPKEKLPTKDCEVLIEYDEHKTHRVVDWNNKSQHFGGFSIDEVTRWKEIE